MSGPLHLLRGVPPNINGEPVSIERFLRLVEIWDRKGHVFGSWTRRAPRRVDELEGGSVYFVAKGATLFRMPFLAIEPVRDFAPDAVGYQEHVAIVCAPKTFPVRAHPVRFMRGWRYLADADKPADLTVTVAGGDDLPPAMVEELKELGLL